MPSRGHRLTQDHIVRAAILVLAKSGVAKFSMRTLAEKLGVALGASYAHVGGKESLLALAADRIVRGIRLSEPGLGSWQERLIEMAHAYRRVFERYPGIGAYLTVHLGETPAAHQAIEQVVSIITRSGIGRHQARLTAAALNAYIRGSVGDDEHPARKKAGRPATHSAARTPTRLDDETFDLGLNLLIQGIEVLSSAQSRKG